MRPPSSFEAKVEEMKPNKSDINWIIMDYLVSEGYPAAAEKFAQETNLGQPADLDGIRERVRIRDAIHAGRVDTAIHLINETDPEILDNQPFLHFNLLQLQLIEIIRGIISTSDPQSTTTPDFLPAIQFATEQLSPRAPTDPKYQKALEHTMALMIFPSNKMTSEFREILDIGLREKVANDVNKSILCERGERAEAKIRQLVRARAWAEAQARSAKVELPSRIPIGLEGGDELNGRDGADTDAIMT